MGTRTAFARMRVGLWGRMELWPSFWIRRNIRSERGDAECLVLNSGFKMGWAVELKLQKRELRSRTQKYERPGEI